MSPLERAARVMCELAGRDPDEVCIGEGAATGQTWLGWEAFRSDARKVVEAIREPTGANLEAGGKTLWAGSREQADRLATKVWHRMIDAILAETNDAPRPIKP